MGSAVSRVRESGGEQITHQALQEALDEAQVPISIAPEDLARLNDPKQLINERQHIGSPAPNRVQEQVEHLGEVLVHNHRPALQVMDRVQQARAQCAQRIADTLLT